jgi:alkanesulfonate monooxygenase SsuD/methylene tetrahydromethanopterin reductase-like flavin-dependent oxidoreductase (luciferase family)
MSGVRISGMFDMRAPSFGAPTRELYAAALDMAAFLDEIGVPRVNLMEHHSSDDGYLPAPFVMGGGFAARTKKCRVSLGAVVLPLHDPVKIAEQIAVLDIMSGGRLEVIFGAGYVPSEFAAFGVPLKERGKRMDQGIEVILRALHGEKFTAPDGRPVNVRPLPLQAPEKIIVVGGGVEASAKRAAHFGLGFVPTNPALLDVYLGECRRLGRTPGFIAAPAPPMNAHLSVDPDATWQRIKPHVAHVVQAYAKWADESPGSHSPFRGLHDVDPLREKGLFVVWTPEELLQHAAKMSPLGTISMAPLLGGLSPAEGWKSLELLKSAMPKLQQIDLGGVS